MTPEGMCYDICTYLPTRSSTNVLWYSFLPSSDRWIAFSDFLSNCQKPPGDGLHVYICKRLWKFPKIGVPLNHPFLEDLPLKTIHFGIPHLWKLPSTIYMLTFLALLSGTVKLWTPKNQQHDGHAWCDMLSAGLFCHMSHEVLVFQCWNILKLSASGIHKRIRSTFAFHQLSINLFKIGQSPGAGAQAAQAAQVQTISSWQQPSEFHRPSQTGPLAHPPTCPSAGSNPYLHRHPSLLQRHVVQRYLLPRTVQSKTHQNSKLWIWIWLSAKLFYELYLVYHIHQNWTNS